MGFSIRRFGRASRRGILAVSGTIYELADSAALGSLPNTIQGVRISGIDNTNNLASNAAQSLPNIGGSVGRTVPAALNPTFSQLPTWGGNLGAGLGNTLGGAGAGLGSGLKDVSKGLIIAVIAVVVLILVLSRPGAANTARAVGSARGVPS